MTRNDHCGLMSLLCFAFCIAALVATIFGPPPLSLSLGSKIQMLTSGRALLRFLGHGIPLRERQMTAGFWTCRWRTRRKHNGAST
jgi:hypothetical protein